MIEIWKYRPAGMTQVCVCQQRTKDINPFLCRLILDFLSLTCADGAVGEDYPASTVPALLFAVWPKVHLQVTGCLWTGSVCGILRVRNDQPSLVFFLNMACVCVFTTARKPLTHGQQETRCGFMNDVWGSRCLRLAGQNSNSVTLAHADRNHHLMAKHTYST